MITVLTWRFSNLIQSNRFCRFYIMSNQEFLLTNILWIYIRSFWASPVQNFSVVLYKAALLFQFSSTSQSHCVHRLSHSHKNGVQMWLSRKYASLPLSIQKLRVFFVWPHVLFFIFIPFIVYIPSGFYFESWFWVLKGLPNGCEERVGTAKGYSCCSIFSRKSS